MCLSPAPLWPDSLRCWESSRVDSWGLPVGRRDVPRNGASRSERPTLHVKCNVVERRIDLPPICVALGIIEAEIIAVRPVTKVTSRSDRIQAL